LALHDESPKTNKTKLLPSYEQERLRVRRGLAKKKKKRCELQLIKFKLTKKETYVADPNANS
jgi:hypothetical protein